MRTWVQVITVVLSLNWSGVALAQLADPTAWAENWIHSTRTRDYSGTVSINGASGMNTYQLWHRYRDGEEEERMRRMDGPLLEVIRQNEDLTCWHGPGADVPADHALPSSPFAQLLHLEPELMAEHYQVVLLREDRVAGREATLYEVIHNTEPTLHRHRLWIDTAHRILLRYQVVDDQGVILSEARFSDIQIGSVQMPRSFTSQFPNAFWHRYQVQNVRQSRDAAEVWSPRYMPAGFSLRVEERRGDGWYQLWSDGVVKLSIMVDPLGDAMPMNTSERRGANTLVAQVHGSWQVVLIGILPEATAQRIATEIEWR